MNKPVIKPVILDLSEAEDHKLAYEALVSFSLRAAFHQRRVYAFNLEDHHLYIQAWDKETALKLLFEQIPLLEGVVDGSFLQQVSR